MKTFRGQFYINEKKIALESQILFPAFASILIFHTNHA